MPIVHCPDGSCAGYGYSQVSHTYIQPATYIVTLNTTWQQGSTILEDTDETYVLIVVESGELAVSAGGPYSGYATYPIQFSGNASWSGGQGPISYTCMWNWQDGTAPSIGKNLFNPVHTFANPGTYNVALEVQAIYDGQVLDTTIDYAEVIVSLEPQNETSRTNLGTVGAFDARRPSQRIRLSGPM